MRKQDILPILGLLYWLLVLGVYARDITVGHGAGYEFQTITAALATASSGDVILVADGEYSADTGESICFPMKDGVTLRRATAGTRPVLRGHIDQPVIYSDVSTARVEGFTITGGDYYSGGGIYINSGSLEVADCTITRNSAQDYGGGVRCSEFSQSTFTSCTIAGNNVRMYHGGGVVCWGQATFVNCKITGNMAKQCGGGVACCGGQAIIANCTIMENEAADGGGVWFSGDSSLINCTILVNRPTGVSCLNCQPTIKNCIIWSNIATGVQGAAPVVTYCCIQGGWSGPGNIDADPRLVAWGDRTTIFIDVSNQGFADGTRMHPFPDIPSALSDYRLCLAIDSPCIGAGEAGTNIGAHYGVGGTVGNSSVVFHIAKGEYDLAGCYFGNKVSIEGSGPEQTVLKGTVYGLRTGCSFRRVKVADGKDSGIKILYGESPTIEECTIAGCTAKECGGGVYCVGNATFVNCAITKNAINGLQGKGAGVYCSGNTAFLNCTIAGNNCTGSYSCGGGVYSYGGAAFTSCTIAKNGAAGGGGGAYCLYGGTFDDCVISENRAGSSGGGIYCDGSLLTSCCIVGNSARYGGGGVFMDNYSGAYSNCTIAGNAAASGGGVYEYIITPTPRPTPYIPRFPYSLSRQPVEDSESQLKGDETQGGPDRECEYLRRLEIPGRANQHDFSSNLAEVLGRSEQPRYNTHFYGLAPLPTPTPLPYEAYSEVNPTSIARGNEQSGQNTKIRGIETNSIAVYGLKNCIIWGNSGGEIAYYYQAPVINYCCVLGGWTGTGNIDSDPMFVNPGHWTGASGQSDWVNGDYHLRDGSACIDAGDPDSLWNDACLPPGKGTQRNDMGAYGGPDNCGWGEATSPPVIFDFDRGTDGWGFLGSIFGFNRSLMKWETAHIGLSPNGSTKCFSYWFSPEIIVQKDNLYHVRWEVTSSVSNTDEVPDFRLRANELSNWRFWSTGVVSLNDAAPTTQPKTYDMIAVPETASSTDTLVLSFDLASFDQTNDFTSWLYLEKVSVDALTTQTISPTVAHYTFDTGAEGWQFQGGIGPFSEPEPTVEPGRVGLSPNGAADSFSYWRSPQLSVDKDKTYRVTWNVSASVSDPEKVIDFRLRCTELSNFRSWETGTLSSQGAAYPSSGQPREYSLFIFPQISTPTDQIVLCFDILSCDASNDLTSWIYLDEVSVNECTIQP
jgi:predicted outer membrane repeat protein